MFADRRFGEKISEIIGFAYPYLPSSPFLSNFTGLAVLFFSGYMNLAVSFFHKDGKAKESFEVPIFLEGCIYNILKSPSLN